MKDEKNHNEMEHEVLERYFSRKKTQKGHTGDLDPIPPELVGTVDVRRLKKVSGRWLWAAKVMRYLLGEVAPIPAEGTPPLVRVVCGTAVAELVRIGLLERCRARTKAACGLFTVPKKNGKLRVIFDARPANVVTCRHPLPLSLFGLDDLLRSWALVGGKVTAIDFRHFFYQLPLPEVWRDYFVVSHDHTRYRPTAVTMGWQDAPLIAQVVTWMVTLHSEPRDPDLRVELVYDGGDMPKYAMLKGQKRNTEGFLFILLDGVAIMSARRNVHEQWVKRVLRNANVFRVHVKEVTEGVFAGVVFEGGRWRPETTLEEWKNPCSRRDVAEKLGQLLWQMRVLQVELLEEESLMRLYSRVGAETCGWDSPMALYPEELEVLQQHWSRYREVTWAEPKQELTVTEWVWAVTDATPTCEATIIFTSGGRVVREEVRSGLEKEAQAHREMGAIVTAAALTGKNKGLLVATDADVCRFAVEKRYSRSAMLREGLRSILGSCREVKVLRVSSEENPADEPSRGLPLVNEKLQRLLPTFQDWNNQRLMK